jgi:hypothetical protein
MLFKNHEILASMHPAKYVGKYLQKCLQQRSLLHRHVCSSLHLDLHLDINLDLHPSLHHALLVEFYPQLLESFLVSLLGSILAALPFDFCLLTLSFFYRPLLPPRQPVGRPLHGRIVVRPSPATTYR